MKYRNWIIAITLALTIGAQAAGVDTHQRETREQDAAERRQAEEDRRRSNEDQSAQAGVCTVYQEATKASKDVTDATWKLAPEIGVARNAAERWQSGLNRANGTMRTSYLLEGERACEAIGARKGNR